MSDTRTIDRACASPVGSQERPLVDTREEKNDYTYERTTVKREAEGERERDPPRELVILD